LLLGGWELARLASDTTVLVWDVSAAHRRAISGKVGDER
jgi:hypothetical protein